MKPLAKALAPRLTVLAPRPRGASRVGYARKKAKGEETVAHAYPEYVLVKTAGHPTQGNHSKETSGDHVSRTHYWRTDRHRPSSRFARIHHLRNGCFNEGHTDTEGKA